MFLANLSLEPFDFSQDKLPGDTDVNAREKGQRGSG
jgi:hypothetical protein